MRLKTPCPEKSFACTTVCDTVCDTLILSLIIHWDISRNKKKRKENVAVSETEFA